MIDLALNFLRETLNTAMQAEKLTITDDTTAEQDLVVFLDGDKVEPISFTQNSVTVLLMNVGQETTMRRADPFRAQTTDGKIRRVTRELRLELSILFVARFRQYDAGLKVLSGIIQFFQEHPVFDHASHPNMPGSVERLMVELQSMSQAEQNEIWNALRTTYLPSILYRTQLVIVSDRREDLPPIVEEATTKLEHID